MGHQRYFGRDCKPPKSGDVRPVARNAHYTFETTLLAKVGRRIVTDSSSLRDELLAFSGSSHTATKLTMTAITSP